MLSSRTFSLTAILLISAATLFAYGEQVTFGLTDVDVHALILTGKFDSLADVKTVLTEPLLQGRMVNATYWRPLTSLLYGLELHLWGLDPIGYQVVDLALHLANGLLLFVFIRGLWDWMGLAKGDGIALLAALLFVIHPAHVENVPAIARRGDLMVAFFLLLTLLGLLRAFRSGGVWPRALSLLSCACAMASKEAGFTVPLIAGAFILFCSQLDGWPGLRSKILQAIPYGIAGVDMFGLRYLAIGSVGDNDVDNTLLIRAVHSLMTHFVGLALGGFPDAQSDILMATSTLRKQYPVLIAVALLPLAYFGYPLARSGARRVDWLGEPVRLFAFLVGAMAMIFVVYLGVMLSPRYLYSSTLFFSALVAWGLVVGYATVRRDAPLKDRLLPGMGFGLLLVLALSIAMTSPIVRDEGMQEWRYAAELSGEVLGQVEEQVAALEPGTRLLLVNFPFRQTGPFLPWSVMLLEHSVEAWLDLRMPEKNFEVVGLSYVAFRPPPETQQRTAVMTNDGLLRIDIAGDGRVQRYPWSFKHGPQYLGKLYRFEGPSQGSSLQIRLDRSMMVPEPIFLVWMSDHVALQRGWSWATSTAERDREP
ncbi:MAG: hypothetical protein JRG89_09165 [Deltaproteobacteria bacterium]|nr:hypothetical protein [Deltaproteobacteria bacterium]